MLCLTTFLVLSLTATPARAPSASGVVRVAGLETDLVDVVAMPFVSGVPSPVNVIMTSKPIDRAEMAEDGRMNMLDRMLLAQVDGLAMVEVDVREGATDACWTLKAPKVSRTECGAAVELTVFSAARIAGRIAWSKGAERIELAFDVPVQDRVEPMVRGTALPPGAGEQGRAVESHLAALASGDRDRILAVSAPPRRARLESASEADIRKALAQMQKMAPTSARATSGSVDADRAWVTFEGARDGKPLRGRAELTRFDGSWYVVKTSVLE